MRHGLQEPGRIDFPGLRIHSRALPEEIGKCAGPGAGRAVLKPAAPGKPSAARQRMMPSGGGGTTIMPFGALSASTLRVPAHKEF